MSSSSLTAAGRPADSPSAPTAPAGPAPLRTDIQGLRALAVSLVVVYHVWPHSLTGGFVGVDVFLVVSGFLITSHLLRRPPRSPRDLASFWSRRVRRLLPASLLVLATTVVATFLVAPETQWATTARQVKAATLYVVNWVLASDAVDYLAAENAPTPVQHFWSLSVEEQFYLFWPVVVMAVVGVAAAARLRRGPAVVAVVALVVVASFVWSVVETASDPAAAYFVTPTRVWELGLGGLLAALLAARSKRAGEAHADALWRSSAAREAVGWIGVAAIAYGAVAYSAATPFPGWRAAVPVVGAALVLAAATDSSTGPLGRVLATRPAQWLGGVSYSVYLWHWPLIVLLPYASGGALGALNRTAIVIATLLLAWFTKVTVEDRFRTRAWGIPLKKPFLLAAVGMAVVLALATALSLTVDHREAQSRAALERAVTAGDPCFGAGALDDPERCADEPGAVVPAPADALKDRSAAYEDVGGRNCWSFVPSYPTVTCTFGDRDGTVDVALVGNSHAGQWLPALEEVADERGWRITTYLASRCAMADVAQRLATTSDSDACRGWVQRTSRRIVADSPDVVLLSNRMSAPARAASSEAAYRDGFAAVLDRWARADLDVVALNDTPLPATTVRSIPECVAENEEDPQSCGASRGAWDPHDPIADSVRKVDSRHVRFADLNDHICGPDRCEAVVGRVIVYFDSSHLTATYARTLAPYLDDELTRALGG